MKGLWLWDLLLDLHLKEAEVLGWREGRGGLPEILGDSTRAW